MSSCTNNSPGTSGGKGTADEAAKFMDDAEKRLMALSIKSGRADWVKSTYITDDTEALAADANKDLIAATTEFAEQSKRFNGVDLPADLQRKMKLLKLSLTLPAPSDPAEREELTKIAASMEGDYGKGKYCPEGDKGKCLSLSDLEEIMTNSRDPEELKKAWLGWHQIAVPIRKDYVRFVELSNKGAKEMGFKDTGAMWREKYDMEPDAFSAEMERLWQQVKPLYDSLYTYTRHKLSEKYGKDIVPEDKPIPAHLLGNMWAQEWANIYPLVEPYKGQPSLDVTAALEQQRWDAMRMVKTGERFFTSLGLPGLPKTFWERSMLVKPRDREVVCHANAWAINFVDDIRIMWAYPFMVNAFRAGAVVAVVAGVMGWFMVLRRQTFAGHTLALCDPRRFGSPGSAGRSYRHRLGRRHPLASGHLGRPSLRSRAAALADSIVF